MPSRYAAYTPVKSSASGCRKMIFSFNMILPSANQMMVSAAIRKPVVRGNAGNRKAMAITKNENRWPRMFLAEGIYKAVHEMQAWLNGMRDSEVSKIK